MRPVSMPFLPGSGPAHELLGALLVTVAFALLFTLVQLWQRRASPPVEWSRKLIHVCGGLVAGCFPWLFATHWTVLALGLGLVVVLRVARLRGWLPALHAVQRQSKGEFYYPLGVYLLFVVARTQPVFYLIALGALVLADSAAAVLGQRYGSLVFTDGDEVRSIEGSVAFFFVTFLAVHLPLLLLTNEPRGTTVIVALQLALLVTSFEAISRGGNDNLLVPLFTYYLLLKLTGRAGADIAFQLASQFTILIVTLAVAMKTRFLTFPGALAAHLMLYGAYSLGNPGWAVTPALALAACIVLDAWYGHTSGRPTGGRQVRAVYYVSIVAALLMFADNTFATLLARSRLLYHGHPFYAPFVGALGAHTAIMTFQALRRRPIRGSRERALLMPLASAAAFGLIALPGLLVGPGSRIGGDIPGTPSFVTAFVVCLLAPPLYMGLRRLVPRPGDAIRDLRLQTVAVLCATLIVLPFHLTWQSAP